MNGNMNDCIEFLGGEKVLVCECSYSVWYSRFETFLRTLGRFYERAGIHTGKLNVSSQGFEKVHMFITPLIIKLVKFI